MSVYFKLLGLRFTSPITPSGDRLRLSDMALIQNGDVLCDEAGLPVSVGVVGIPYNAEPTPASLSPEETKFWYDIYTNTVHFKTKKTDGVTIVTGELGLGDTGGFMELSTYDPALTGRVTYAAALSDGSNTVTAYAVIVHMADSQIHTPLNDLVTTAGNVWSASLVQTKLNLKSDIGHIHSLLSDSANGFAPLTGTVTGDRFLRDDLIWVSVPDNVYIDRARDVNLAYVDVADILIRNSAGEWQNTRILTDSHVSVVFDEEARTLTFGLESGYNGSYTVEEKTSSYPITTSDKGKVIRANSASSITLSLPSVGASDVGMMIMVTKNGTGTVIVDAADSDTIADSGAGDTIENTTSETYATLTLILTEETHWDVMSKFGTWTTTS